MKKLLLIGNPNTGKTTLFNSLTKSHEHIGNWHGVTVSEKAKQFVYREQVFELVDLPGLYSLSALSYEEQVACESLYKNMDSLVINICDINNLQRNLYLTLQLLELGLDVILVINTMGKGKKFLSVDKDILEKELKIETILINADSKKEVNLLKEKIYNHKKINKENNFDYLKNIKNNEIFFNLTQKIENIAIKYSFPKNYFAIKLLEKDDYFFNLLDEKSKAEIENLTANISVLDVAKARHFRCEQICNLATKRLIKKAYGEEKLDKIFLNKFLALPIFALIMLAVFYLTFFSLGAWLSGALQDLINLITSPIVQWIRSVCPLMWVGDLFEYGIVGGVGSLVSFLPQIVLLFFFLSILEDSGYLARLAFCFEDIFKKVGLSGKSVYTLLMGFGCSATAALTARNMEDKNSKIKTAMLTPYMSCSAKLPIYAVLGGAFFGASNVFLIFLLYLLGVIVALVLSMILEKTSLKSKNQSFILEFPPYRFPSFKRVWNIIGENLKQFLVRIGSVIVSVNIIVWVLSSFSFGFEYVVETGGKSMLQTLGEILSPIFIPLGFGNWGATSALIAGIVAKEVIVSSIAIFNNVSAGGEFSIADVSASLTDPMSAVYFTPASALSYMVFCLLYCPCAATMSVLSKEIGKKWTIISIVIQFVIAYMISMLVFLLFGAIEKFGAGLVIGGALGVLAVCLSIVYLVLRRKKKSSCGNCELCKF